MVWRDVKTKSLMALTSRQWGILEDLASKIHLRVCILTLSNLNGGRYTIRLLDALLGHAQNGLEHRVTSGLGQLIHIGRTQVLGNDRRQNYVSHSLTKAQPVEALQTNP